MKIWFIIFCLISSVAHPQEWHFSKSSYYILKGIVQNYSITLYLFFSPQEDPTARYEISKKQGYGKATIRQGLLYAQRYADSLILRFPENSEFSGHFQGRLHENGYEGIYSPDKYQNRESMSFSFKKAPLPLNSGHFYGISFTHKQGSPLLHTALSGTGAYPTPGFDKIIATLNKGFTPPFTEDNFFIQMKNSPYTEESPSPPPIIAYIDSNYISVGFKKDQHISYKVYQWDSGNSLPLSSFFNSIRENDLLKDLKKIALKKETSDKHTAILTLLEATPIPENYYLTRTEIIFRWNSPQYNFEVGIPYGNFAPYMKKSSPLWYLLGWK